MIIAEAADFVNKNLLAPIDSLKIKMSFPLPRSTILQVFLAIILILVLAEFLMFSYLSKGKVTDLNTKYIKDYETILCRLEMGSGKAAGNPNAVCPVEGIVTAFKHWSLAKNMWLYADLLALSIATSLKAYVPVCLKESLDNIFANISLPNLSTIGHCLLPLSDSVSSLDDWEDISQSIVISDTEIYNDLVIQHMDTARREFVFHDALKSLARDYLIKVRRIVNNQTSTVVYIAVYISKSTIIINQEYDDLYPSIHFFLSAMNYFRKKFTNTIFVVLTDRQDIWRSIFKAKDIFIADEDSLENVGAVLSVLSHCNHTILSSEGNAVWAAILAGGETVVSVSLSEDYKTVIKYHKQWIYVTNNSQPADKDAVAFN